MGGTSKNNADYEFLTVWRVAGTPREVMDILGDAGTLPRWWPSAYLRVVPLDPGNADGTGKAFSLHSKGWLPYTLRWRLTVTEPITERGFALAASGDLRGTGRWTFEQDGPETVVTYDWRVSTSKPLLRRLGWLLKPAFAANHHWAMARGQESLALELRRRRPGTDLSKVPRPTPPTFARRYRWPRSTTHA
jgi:hypothetical protein